MIDFLPCLAPPPAFHRVGALWFSAMVMLLWSGFGVGAQAQHVETAAEGPLAVLVADQVAAPIDDPVALSAKLRAALEQAGHSVLGDAAERFSQYHSKPAADLPTDVMDSLREQIDKVTRDLAMGDLPSAVEGMEAIEGLQHQALVQLNRESEQARRLFTACVAMGVMLHDSGKDEDALSRLQHCAATFPGFRLSPDAFSPQAISLYQSAVASIDPVILRVDNGSPELACTVRFNGLNVGTAPAELRAQRGWAGVQLECADRPARMHVIMLSESKQRLVIDPVLEYAVQAEGAALWLRYNDEETLARRLEEHGLSIVTALRVSRGVVARRLPSGEYRLSLLDAELKRTLAETTWDGSEGTLSQALTKLLSMAVAPNPAQVASQNDMTAYAAQEPSPHTLVGLSTTWAWAWPVIGVAYGTSVGLSLYLLGQRGNDREYATYLSTTSLPQAYVVSELSQLGATYDNRGTLALVLGSASNALALAGSVLALPEHDGFLPYWAYISGGLGLAMAGTGVAFLAMGNDCGLIEGCAFAKSWDRDPLLPALALIHAVGPLSVPVAYLIAKLVGVPPSTMQFQASATASSAHLTLQGRF